MQLPLDSSLLEDLSSRECWQPFLAFILGNVHAGASGLELAGGCQKQRVRLPLPDRFLLKPAICMKVPLDSSLLKDASLLEDASSGERCCQRRLTVPFNVGNMHADTSGLELAGQCQKRSFRLPLPD